MVPSHFQAFSTFLKLIFTLLTLMALPESGDPINECSSDGNSSSAC